MRSKRLTTTSTHSIALNDLLQLRKSSQARPTREIGGKLPFDLELTFEVAKQPPVSTNSINTRLSREWDGFMSVALQARMT